MTPTSSFLRTSKLHRDRRLSANFKSPSSTTFPHYFKHHKYLTCTQCWKPRLATMAGISSDSGSLPLDPGPRSSNKLAPEIRNLIWKYTVPAHRPFRSSQELHNDAPPFRLQASSRRTPVQPLQRPQLNTHNKARDYVMSPRSSLKIWLCLGYWSFLWCTNTQCLVSRNSSLISHLHEPKTKPNTDPSHSIIKLAPPSSHHLPSPSLSASLCSSPLTLQSTP